MGWAGARASCMYVCMYVVTSAISGYSSWIQLPEMSFTGCREKRLRKPKPEQGQARHLSFFVVVVLYLDLAVSYGGRCCGIYVVTLTINNSNLWFQFRTGDASESLCFEACAEKKSQRA